MPQFCSGRSVAMEYDLVVVSNCGGESVKSNITSSITKLANRDQRMMGKVRYDVHSACGWWEVGEVKVGFVRRLHRTSIGVANGDRITRKAFVDNWSVGGAKMSCTAGVGDEQR